MSACHDSGQNRPNHFGRKTGAGRVLWASAETRKFRCTPCICSTLSRLFTTYELSLGQPPVVHLWDHRDADVPRWADLCGALATLGLEVGPHGEVRRSNLGIESSH